MNIVKLHDNRITLINGDCLEVLPKVKPNSIDMIFADLPYGTTANKWDIIIPLDKLWLQLKNVSKLTTPYVMTAMVPFDKILGVSNIQNLKYEWIWEKKDPTNHLNAKHQPMRKHEHVLVFYATKCTYNPQMTYDGKPYKNTSSTFTTNYGKVNTILQRDNNGIRYPISIIKTETNNKGTVHPTQKPVELLEYLIKTYTNENDVVLDPTAGSFTTAVACINTNRRCIAIEKDTEFGYFNIGIDRCNAAIAELIHE